MFLQYRNLDKRAREHQDANDPEDLVFKTSRLQGEKGRSINSSIGIATVQQSNAHSRPSRPSLLYNTHTACRPLASVETAFMGGQVVRRPGMESCFQPLGMLSRLSQDAHVEV